MQTHTEDAAQWHVARRKRRLKGCIAILLTPVVVVLIIFGWFGIRMFDKPTIARNYTAEFNEQFDGVPESDRAWPVLKQAILLQTESPLPDTLRDVWPIYPGWAQWDQAKAWIIADRPILDLIREGAKRPVLGRLLSNGLDPDIAQAEAKRSGGVYVPEATEENPMLLGVLLPELGKMRGWAHDLMVDSYRALEDGNSRTAIENVETTLRLGVHSRANGTLIGQIVQIAIETLASQSTMRMVESYPDAFTEPDLLRLQDAFTTIGRGGMPADGGLTRIKLDMTLERAWFFDAVQRIYSDNGHGNGHMTLDGIKLMGEFGVMAMGSGNDAAGLANAGLFLLSASRKDLTDKYNDLMDRFETSAALRPWDRGDQLSSIEAEFVTMRADPLTMSRYAIITLLMPAMSKAVNTMDLADAQRDATITFLALERWKREHGQYPETLDLLVPGLIPGLPLDPVDGEPLRYLLDDGVVTLYSLGADKDDDLGSRGEEERGTQPGRSSGEDGDWVLVPQPALEEPKED